MWITDADVDRWLAEDIGHDDVSNDIPGSATATIVATEAGTIAGLSAAEAVFDRLDVSCERHVEEGDAVDASTTIMAVSGPTQSLLRGERVATNLIGHASGIATKTAQAVTQATAVDPSVTVAATRKTTPGLRGLEKHAVAVAGGDTHRLDLSHMVMIKDNHIAAFGLEGAIDRLRDRASFATNIEVEATSIDQAERAATAGADAVLLDNMDPETVAKAVDVLPATVTIEASGGIDLSTIADYAQTGVDVISMGSLTHSAPSLDLSFRLDATG